MPTLRALFVAINDYPNPAHRLMGCISDMEKVKKALQIRCDALGLIFDPLILTNEAATRKAIIDAFSHFSADADDSRLFYFAGHGARSAAPEAFWHLEPDHKNDSLVCWDSRLPGGYDLMDKELSWLIWKVNQGSKLPFVTIMDCCHSGSLRNLESDLNWRVRSLRDIGLELTTYNYIGIQDYKKSSNGELTPPQGRRIHLGASRDSETAKEVKINGEDRGIFSYFLADCLTHSGQNISYSDLMREVQIQVRGNVSDQSPQLWATEAFDKSLVFLSSDTLDVKITYLLGYDKNRGWRLNAGAVHGFSKGTDEQKTILEIPELNRQIEISDVYPDVSAVVGMKEEDEKKIYSAYLIQWPEPIFNVAFMPSENALIEATLKSLVEAKSSNLFKIVSDEVSPDFLIHIDKHALWLSLPDDAEPLFEKTIKTDTLSLQLFINKMKAVFAWRQRLMLEHPGSRITASEIEITLYRVIEPGNMENDTLTERVNLNTSPVSFSYKFENNTLFQPAFQYRVRNASHRTLWFSLLYFGADYSISNALLPKHALSPGEEIWANEVFDGHVYRTIPLNIDDSHLEQGVDRIKEYLKLFVCTEELDTDSLCQQGLNELPVDGHRMLDLRKKITQRDWKCIVTQIEIVR